MLDGFRIERDGGDVVVTLSPDAALRLAYFCNAAKHAIEKEDFDGAMDANAVEAGLLEVAGGQEGDG